MQTFPHMVDMSKTPKEMAEDYTLPEPSDGPNYPYGLCISLCEDELDKLDVDTVEVGSIVHLHAFGVVTSSSQPLNGSGRRVEIQITHLSAENEDEENEDDEAEEKDYLGKMYK